MSNYSQNDIIFMQRAIALAQKGRFTTRPNPIVGCVIVLDNNIVGEGYHYKAGLAHAEVNALAQAKELSVGSTCYVTLEPCCHHGRVGPCVESLIRSGIEKVFVAMADPNVQMSGKGIAILREHNIEVDVGLLESEARQLNIAFFHRMMYHKPYVVLKTAMSLDGKIALANGASKWITNATARSDVQKLRLASCAIITGSHSVLIDNPRMNVRFSELPSEVDIEQKDILQPWVVVIDSEGILTPDLRIFAHERVLLIHNKPIKHVFQDNVRCVSIAVNEQGKIDLLQLLYYLAQLEINQVLVESGAGLLNAFIQSQLWNEFIVYQAPQFLGVDAYSMWQQNSFTDMNSVAHYIIQSVELLDNNVKLIMKSY